MNTLFFQAKEAAVQRSSVKNVLLQISQVFKNFTSGVKLY